MNRKHLIWMIIGCTVPLLLLFLAPAFGLNNNSGLFIFILAMFAVHLLMPHGHAGHGHGGEQEHQDSNQQKKEPYERHQH